MIVDKNIELEIKYLKEYPEWQFLSKEDLNRKTIQIFDDLKIAKRYCKKEQKVIKVPNTNVFRIAKFTDAKSIHIPDFILEDIIYIYIILAKDEQKKI